MKPSIHGLVLAGGKSSRMGADKAALVHPDGRTLLRRTCDLLKQAGCGIVAVSLRHDQEIPTGFEEAVIVRDPDGASRGPLAGMIAGMQLDPAADWLVIACDLPRMDLGTLRNLIDEREPNEAFLSYRSEFDRLPEPLCACYSAAALPLLEKAFAEDLRCPRKILLQNDCRLLEPVTPRALDNANTPDDWDAATRP